MREERPWLEPPDELQLPFLVPAAAHNLDGGCITSLTDHPSQEHETHLAVLAGKATASTTMPALKTVTRAALRCSSLCYFFHTILG